MAMPTPPEFLQYCRSGSLQEAEQLLDSQPSLALLRDGQGMTGLHHAAEKDHLEMARLLLASGADIEARTDWGYTPFDWAASLGSARVARLLLDHGASGLNLVSGASLGMDRYVSEQLGEESGRAQAGRRALPAEPDRHWPANSAAMQGDVVSDAFFGACRNGHRSTAKLLLQTGADINACGVFGASTLHWAAINGHRNVVELLVSAGARLDQKDPEFDATPVGWAREGGHQELADFLLHRALKGKENG